MLSPHDRAPMSGALALGLVLSLLLASLPARASDPSDQAASDLSAQLTVEAGRMTAKITSAPMRQVVERLGRLTGAEISWVGDEGQRAISVEFVNLPLTEALARILACNFVATYTASAGADQLIGLRIWPAFDQDHAPVATQGQTVPAAPRISTTKAGPNAAHAQLVPRKPTPEMRPARVEPDDERTAVSLDGIIDGALIDQNPSSRLRSIGILELFRAEDPRIEGILYYLAHNDSDVRVRTAASTALNRMNEMNAKTEGRGD